MSTYVVFTIDDLDAELKAIKDRWTNRSDFTTLRNRALRRTMAEYQASLHNADDIFGRANTYDAPITIGTEKINTTVGDVYKVALPAGAVRVAGDAIQVAKATTATFVNVPRMEWADIIASGVDQTPYAFWEENGILMIYDKDGNFDNTAVCNFSYYRSLDVTQTPTTTPLDIKPNDFAEIIDNVDGFMSSYV